VTAHTRRNEARNRLETFGAVQDVTERKRAEDAISKMRTELAHVARVSALGTLAASIAHEVNQPLGAIMVNGVACGHWLEGATPNVAEARSAAERVVRDATRAAGVIARLRALFNKAGPVSELLDLNEAIADVIALTRREMQEAHVIVRSDLGPGLPAIRGDRVQLQQVVLNLVLNAAEAMSGVGDRPRELAISTQAVTPDQVEIAVRDTGKGLDPVSATRIFEPFYTTKSSGMGMGLSISKSIVEEHGGSIRVEPNADAGVTLRVTIPRRGQATP
jgi:C4-dicarboxylate-specific signal transduction histidine kinase